MNQEEIKQILPHRRSMLLLEQAVVTDGVAHGQYHVRGDEWFLDGHFPDNPVVPGVILCEMLAQSACVLLADGCPADTTPYFTSMDKVRFKNPVHPGDTYETESRIIKSKGPFYFCEGQGTVNGKVCLKAEFSFALVKKG
ncbi:MAG: beta-hydroxyacyl-ACP dehydratase [Oscillospiraceae bacterium]|nr:beta-hydroxyacyl-ACP dehydratase [Oscillospiraceae bacterium]